MSVIPRPGQSVPVSIDAPFCGDQQYYVLAGLDNLPGIDVGDFHIPVNPNDPLTIESLNPNSPFFSGFQGTIDPLTDSAEAQMFLPALPGLEGLSFILTVVVLNSDFTGIDAVMETPLFATIGPMATTVTISL